MNIPKYQYITLNFTEHILHVALNRPPVHALNMAMVAELHQCADWISKEDDIWTVSLTASGKVFCAGADLKERAHIAEENIDETVHQIRMMTQAWANIPQVVIVGINGIALGGGLELALAGDIIAMHENAVIGLPETSLGIIPGAGGTQRLSRRASLSVAKKWILTAGKFNAIDALRDGVIDYVFPKETYDEDYARLLTSVVKNAPQALRSAKFALDKGAEKDIINALDIEGEAYKKTIPTEDRTEALIAFKEKRKPNWKGR